LLGISRSARQAHGPERDRRPSRSRTITIDEHWLKRAEEARAAAKQLTDLCAKEKMLERRLAELPSDREIVAYCEISQSLKQVDKAKD